MNKRTLLLIPALSATLLLFACGQPAAEKSETPSAAPQETAQAAPQETAQAAPPASPADGEAQAPTVENPDRILYVCEMGHEVSPEPGRCSKCGMALQEVKASQISFTCGQCGYAAKEPGVCPHCKVELTFQRKP